MITGAFFMMHLLAMPVIILASMQQHSDIAGFLSLLSTLVGPGATLVWGGSYSADNFARIQEFRFLQVTWVSLSMRIFLHRELF